VVINNRKFIASSITQNVQNTGGLDLDPPGTARQGLAWPCRLLSILMSSHGKRGFTVVENCGETQKNEKELGDDKTETVS